MGPNSVLTINVHMKWVLTVNQAHAKCLRRLTHSTHVVGALFIIGLTRKVESSIGKLRPRRLLALNPGPTLHKLCDLGQVTSSLCAFIFLLVKQGAISG